MEKINHKWSALDYDGEGRTTDDSAKACGLRCEKASLCVGSSFWSSDGGCHLSTFGSVLESDGSAIAYSCQDPIEGM